MARKATARIIDFPAPAQAGRSIETEFAVASDTDPPAAT